MQRHSNKIILKTRANSVTMMIGLPCYAEGEIVIPWQMYNRRNPKAGRRSIG